MWNYEKRLLFPVMITAPDLHLAGLLFEPYAGAASALTAAMTYLCQRYTMPSGALMALLTDIGTEKLSHMEMLAGMIGQSLQGVPQQELKKNGLDSLYIAHGRSLIPKDSRGCSWSAAYTVSSGDALADLKFDIALESRLRAQYERLILLSKSTCYSEPLEFLDQRSAAHHRCLSEAKDLLKEQKENGDD